MIADFNRVRKPGAWAGREFIDFLVIPAIVVIVGVAAFGLGRLSVLKEIKGSVVIHGAEDSATPDGNRDTKH